MCSQPVYPGQNVYFDHGQIVHLLCWVTSPDILRVVETFLRQNTGKRHCHRCIAETLGIRYDDISKAVARLRLGSDYRVEPAMCAICRNDRVTIGFRPDRPVS